MPFAEANGVTKQTGQNFFKTAPLNTMGTWIPEIWSSQFIEDLQASLILGSSLMVNRQYEGLVRNQGDTVRIPHFNNSVTVTAGYTPYSEVASPDRANLDSLLLRVNEGFTFGFEVDDLHQLQTASGVSLMEGLVREAARTTAEYMDAKIVNVILKATTGKDANNADAALHGTAHTEVYNGTDEVYDLALRQRTILDINNVPQSGRFILIGPSEYATILKDPRFIDASQYGAGAVVTNGEVGRILGMPVLVSNTIGSHLTDATLSQLPGVAGGQLGIRGTKNKGVAYETIKMVVGHTSAITLAEQLTRMESYRPEKKFTTAVKGLEIFGAKCMRPEYLTVVTNPVTP